MVQRFPMGPTPKEEHRLSLRASERLRQQRLPRPNLILKLRVRPLAKPSPPAQEERIVTLLWVQLLRKRGQIASERDKPNHNRWHPLLLP